MMVCIFFWLSPVQYILITTFSYSLVLKGRHSGATMTDGKRLNLGNQQFIIFKAFKSSKMKYLNRKYVERAIYQHSCESTEL